MIKYSNIPYIVPSNSESTLQAFGEYYSAPTETDATVLAAIAGYFTSKGFEETAAGNISIIIILQAKQDGYNPMEILDTLKGLDSVELSGLVSELLNYNRFKTSSLGYAQEFKTNIEIQRNIVA